MLSVIRYFEVIRARACTVPLAIGVLAVAMGIEISSGKWTPFAVLAGISVSYLSWASHQVWNDIFDKRVDEKAGKERPLASEEISILSATVFAVILSTISVLIVIYSSVWASLVFAVGTVLGITYSKWFKRKGISGSFLFGVSCSVLFLTALLTTISFSNGGSTHMFQTSSECIRIFFIGAGLFLTQTAENIAGTIKDMKTDVISDVKTVGTQLTPKKTGTIAVFLTSAGLLLFMTALFIHTPGGFYLFVTFGVLNWFGYIDGIIFVSFRTNRSWMGITFLYEFGLYLGFAFALTI